MYELPHDFSYDLRLRILGYKQISGKSQKFVQAQPNDQCPLHKQKKLVIVQEDWTKSAVKLFVKVLFYLISYIGGFLRFRIQNILSFYVLILQYLSPCCSVSEVVSFRLKLFQNS